MSAGPQLTTVQIFKVVTWLNEHKEEVEKLPLNKIREVIIADLGIKPSNSRLRSMMTEMGLSWGRKPAVRNSGGSNYEIMVVIASCVRDLADSLGFDFGERRKVLTYLKGKRTREAAELSHQLLSNNGD